MNELFTIGDFTFRLICPEGITIPENLLKFRGGDASAYTYHLELADHLPEPVGRVIARREDLLVTQGSGGECRHLGIRGRPEPYACYMETGPDEARVLLSAGRTAEMGVDTMFNSLLALEKRLLDREGLVLHCAYMDLDGQAVLFSAPSGTGKSTQAELWRRYRGTRTVNGDRCLLQKIGDVWFARGWPVCGSSEICFREDLPVRAVVTLSQAPEDRIWRLSPAQAFTQLFSQITVNRWNREASLRAMELTEQLIGAVPVYHLACTMSESAVRALESALGETNRFIFPES